MERYPLVFGQKIFAAGIHQQKNASGIAIIIYIHGGMAQLVEHIVHIMGRGAEAPPVADEARRKRSETVGSSPTVTTTAQPLKIKGCIFLSPRHHCRGVRFFQGSLRRCERLVPPFRSHGRLAQLPELSGWLHWWK